MPVSVVLDKKKHGMKSLNVLVMEKENSDMPRLHNDTQQIAVVFFI